MNPEKFKANIDHKKVDLFVLENKGKMRVCISNYGARILSIEFTDKNNKMIDVTLGYGSLEEHIKKMPYFGALIGRCANRIGLGKFDLDGKIYQLSQNMFPNHLHGGINGFSHKVWTPIEYGNNKLKLQHVSIDMEEGYPGELTSTATFELTKENELVMEIEAKSDAKTIVNMTTHPFFNLEGENYPDVLEQKLKINADCYLAMSKEFLPDKKIEVEQDSVFDFREFKTIGKDMKVEHKQIKIAGDGYDHNYILNTKGIDEVAASAYAPQSGIGMDIYTNQPGMQFYSSNGFDGNDVGKSGTKYKKYAAFCLEPQYFPNSPNRDDFPSIVLEKGKIYYHCTKFHFFNTQLT